MALQPQTIVEPANPADKPKGARKESNLHSIFPESPIYKGDMTDANVTAAYQTVMDGGVTDGYGFPNFVASFTDPNNPLGGAPDIAKVKTGGGGLPATPYVPNPTSPGAGVTTAGAVASYQGSIPASAPEYGSGLGGTVSPNVTSNGIESQTLGNYLLGRSYPGSSG
tara:strand:- start:4179 stop:4679 length:501 start_codon:yes stop_codon:yes gene_type:complete